MGGNGYSTNTDTMSSSAKKISDSSTQLAKDLKDVSPTPIVDKEFGTAHTVHFNDYKAAVDEMGKGIQGMCATMESFASTVGSSGSSYAQTEGSNTTNFNNQG